MEQLKYKVEVFIAPKENIYSRQFKINDMQIRSDVIGNVIGDIKENNANHIQSNKNNSFSMEKVNVPNLEKYIETGKSVTENAVDLNDFDKDAAINFCSSLDIPEVKREELFNEDKVCYFTNVLHRIHNFSPNKEKNEGNRDKQVELCYHAYNNGSCATISLSQEVSDKIFNEIGLQKLEDIKQRELLLRNREIVLQNHEKALLEKERELELLKRNLIGQLKQLDLQFKGNKQICLFELNTLEALEGSLGSAIDMDSKQINAKSDTNNDSEIELNNLDVNKMNLYIKDSQTQSSLHKQNEQLHRCTHNMGIVHKALCEEKVSSGSYPCAPPDDIIAGRKLKLLTNRRDNKISKSASSRFGYDKAKKLPKDYYDDLDTTLSADIGDSSFVQTSKKFNPTLYKKPYVFRRATSEHHMKYTNYKNSVHVEVEGLSCCNTKHQVPSGIEQDKVFKKVTRNIFASQDKSTKFRHYGLIDQNMEVINKLCTIKSEKRYSYLNLEAQNKSCSCLNLTQDLNNRPISWNAGDEWFKKRQSVNNRIEKKVHVDNKENLEYNLKTKDKFEKVLKKRDIKTKILTIFR